MNKLSPDDILKLANLSKIEIDEKEVSKYQEDINNILAHLSLVSSADFSQVENKFLFSNVTRNDNPKHRDFNRDTLLSNIPKKSKDNFVIVPKVLKK